MPCRRLLGPAIFGMRTCDPLVSKTRGPAARNTERGLQRLHEDALDLFGGQLGGGDCGGSVDGHGNSYVKGVRGSRGAPGSLCGWPPGPAPAEQSLRGVAVPSPRSV